MEFPVITCLHEFLIDVKDDSSIAFIYILPVI